MRMLGKPWAVVLAAGDGTRLATLTTDSQGNAVPKQFCSLTGGETLIQEAIRRAASVAPPAQVCTVVAERHQHCWRDALRALPATNIIVQPCNRGTANGILLAVLTILARDPLARIVFLPADHFVRDEAALQSSLREAATLVTRHFESLVLVGITPDEADPEFGYILPGTVQTSGARNVSRFIEKPELSRARQLIAHGALWNSFIFCAHASTLLNMLRAHLGDRVASMAAALTLDRRLNAHTPSGALAEFYDTLQTVDFCRQIVQGSEAVLRVVTASACGWSDLGTPRRVADTLRRLRRERPDQFGRHPSSAPSSATCTYINLAVQHARLGLGS
jgi:mannose-1-phosphate guanylyltransferase